MKSLLKKLLFTFVGGAFVCFVAKGQTSDTVRTNYPANEVLTPYSYKFQNISISQTEAKDYFINRDDVYGPLGLLDLDKSNFNIIERINYPGFLFVRYKIKNGETIKLRKYSRKDYLTPIVSGFKGMTIGDKNNPFQMTYYCYGQSGDEFYFTEGDKDKGIAFITELLTKKFTSNVPKYITQIHVFQNIQQIFDVAEAVINLYKISYSNYSWGEENSNLFQQTDFKVETFASKLVGKLNYADLTKLNFTITTYDQKDIAKKIFQAAYEQTRNDLNARRVTESSVALQNDVILYKTPSFTSVFKLNENSINSITAVAKDYPTKLADEIERKLNEVVEKLKLPEIRLQYQNQFTSNISGKFNGLDELK